MKTKIDSLRVNVEVTSRGVERVYVQVDNPAEQIRVSRFLSLIAAAIHRFDEDVQRVNA
jgi:hypothetical protein